MSVRAPDRAERPAAAGGHRADLVAGAVLLALVAAAVVVLLRFEPLRQYGRKSFRNASNLFGEWPVLGTLEPHLGPGTPLAVATAIAVLAWGPGLAERLSWRALLSAGYGTALVWTLGLAMVDGWRRGVTARLFTADEYLHEVPGITDVGVMLRTFTSRILDYQPNSWATHVSGHPPGATLVFVWLDRIGLGGPTIAGLVCMAVGSLAAVAVPVTIKALGAPDLARTAVLFLVLFPGAVWVGASADGLFAGVTASGIALLAVGAATRRWLLSLAGGLLLGYGIYLSYGLLLLGAVALAAVAITRNWWALLPAALGVLAVAAAFTLAGFWWVDGYHLVVQRYYQGIGNIRPYRYWVWGNLACLAVVLGPAVAPGLRRAVAGRGRVGTPVVVLAGTALLAVLAADLSGLSKAETERIWLPFAVWLVPLAALLPPVSRRWWLAGQAVLALAVNHVLVTSW